jgi:ribosomal peptide maturation radical SAM protein 1
MRGARHFPNEVPHMTDSAVRPPVSRTAGKVLLVVPPLHGLRCPALGVSQLKGNLLAAGIPAEVLYLNLDFAERTNPTIYEWLTATGFYLVGEVIFSHVLYDRPESDLDRYLDEILQNTEYAAGLVSHFPGKDLRGVFRHLIDHARDFLHRDAIPQILQRDPWMVGLSSVFESNCASLAIIQELKKVRPDVLTIMGGANCESECGVEILQRFPAVDFVSRGESDNTFVAFVRDLRAGKPAAGHLGMLTREDSQPSDPSPPLHRAELDANAYPDFDDFFARLSTYSYKRQVRPGLSMETSRGCWWGAVSHCTFCAFNRDGMVYRSKEPERALAEMRAQVSRYGVPRIELTDNILDMDYFKSVVRELGKEPVGELFWETKANLSLEQVRAMKKAGIVWIQPGIESLSDKTLKLMRKGSTQLQNIQLLKWCTESGIRITWNWLYGFPGEDPDEIDELEPVAAAIHHILPPGASPVIYLERFSPYFMEPEKWGIAPIRPADAYRHIYPLPDDSLRKLAFFFTADHFSTRTKSHDYSRLEGVVENWKQAHAYSHLLAAPREDVLVLLDSRLCAKQERYDLRGVERRIYEFCWTTRGEKELLRTFAGECSPDDVLSILQGFCDNWLMLGRNGRYLSLATDVRFGYREWPAVFPGGQLTDDAVAQETKLQRRLRQLLAVMTLKEKPADVMARMRASRSRKEMAARGARILTTARQLAEPGAPICEGTAVGAAASATGS